MACNSNGRTYVNTVIPVPGATATDATYCIDLTHYSCGNRKICANGAYPLTCNLNYQVYNAPRSIGNDSYVVDILASGTVTYLPYKCGQSQCGCGCECPVTENVWAIVSVPVASATVPTITAGTVLASPTGMRDCCNVTNAMSLVGCFNLATA